MKHLTKEYNQSCNYIICTVEEYNIMQKAFLVHGIKIRMISRYQNEVKFQISNPYKEYCNNHFNGAKIKELAENDLEINN